MKATAGWILLLSTIVFPFFPAPPAVAQNEPAIPPGYVELARERRGNSVIVYLGTKEDKLQYTKIGERLAVVDGAIAKIGAELKTQRDIVLPAFGEKYVEWLELDTEARKEMTAAGVGLLEVGFISALRIRAAKGRALSQAELDRIWEEFRNSPLARDEYQFFLRRFAKNAGEIRKWRGEAEFLEWCQKAHDVNSFLIANDRENYGKALASLLSLALNDPRAHILVAEVEFVGAVLMAHATEYAARQEINRLLDMQTQSLGAVTQNCRKMKDLVDERKMLRSERTRILEKTSPLKP